MTKKITAAVSLLPFHSIQIDTDTSSPLSRRQRDALFHHIFCTWIDCRLLMFFFYRFIWKMASRRQSRPVIWWFASGLVQVSLFALSIFRSLLSIVRRPTMESATHSSRSHFRGVYQLLASTDDTRLPQPFSLVCSLLSVLPVRSLFSVLPVVHFSLSTYSLFPLSSTSNFACWSVLLLLPYIIHPFPLSEVYTPPSFCISWTSFFHSSISLSIVNTLPCPLWNTSLEGTSSLVPSSYRPSCCDRPVPYVRHLPPFIGQGLASCLFRLCDTCGQENSTDAEEILTPMHLCSRSHTLPRPHPHPHPIYFASKWLQCWVWLNVLQGSKTKWRLV